MLNLVTFEPEDAELLERSFNAIKQKDSLEIVVDEELRNEIFQQVITALRTPQNASFSFQNLFKIGLPTGKFYIAQCLVDFGYPISGKLPQTVENKYYFQTIGVAHLKIDLGTSLLRRETKTDRLIGRFFDYDIDFKGCKEFNDKFYLVSNKKAQIEKAFDKSFLNLLSHHNNIVLVTRNCEMYISFTNELSPNQSRIIEDIFSHFNFLAD